jgi:ferredoxin-NADP reductase
VQETPDVRTFRLDNREARLPFDRPGTFAKVCVNIDDEEVWRSFTISSSPARAEFLDLTIKLNPDGQVSKHLFDEIRAGDRITIKGAQGGFFFDPHRHTEPLALVSAGSGITPMMSIVRFLADNGAQLPCWFLYGARSGADIIFHEECRRLAAEHEWFRYHVTLSQPDDTWDGCRGRLDLERLTELVPEPVACRYFLCGPNDFMQTLTDGVRGLGVPPDRIHTEQFHASPRFVEV